MMAGQRSRAMLASVRLEAGVQFLTATDHGLVLLVICYSI
jgi:hypothetical protein